MANLKRFTLENYDYGWQIELEVDLDKLTAERATMINEFWTGDTYRLSEAGGDAVRAVVKLAGERLMQAFLGIGGAFIVDGDQSAIWTKQELHEEEGWGGTDGDDPFGWCGIRLVSADAQLDVGLEFKEG